ncbi:hypothetical protein JCM21714_3368 [Gracilibacillus boraciitolerans JCM 21714]|uniref:HPr domain-containing protein n=1 Tax=Gracilibacillus boraciitolerans JCM 21714 TaxID=1298598 RepID=W4VN07_9BACI|nr:hypothetical protein [Gracilibacillus boraciitolerans]GAE94228.1 hypothetical protein JCM21714_3368 [Gracilibacillus boraciitolerans JCM 21714]
MKKFLSTQVTLEEKLSMKQIISFFQYEKNYNGSIYILGNHQMISLHDLPGLVAFSLLTSADCDVQFVVEGINPEQALEDLQNYLTTDGYYLVN